MISFLFQYHALKNHPKSAGFFGNDSKIEYVEEVTIEEEKKSDEEKAELGEDWLTEQGGAHASAEAAATAWRAGRGPLRDRRRRLGPCSGRWCGG